MLSFTIVGTLKSAAISFFSTICVFRDVLVLLRVNLWKKITPLVNKFCLFFCYGENCRFQLKLPIFLCRVRCNSVWEVFQI